MSQIEALEKFNKTYCNCIQFNWLNKIGECGKWVPESIDRDMGPNFSKEINPILISTLVVNKSFTCFSSPLIWTS